MGGESDRQLMLKALNEIKRLRQEVSILKRERDDAVAVVGMGCRFPGDCSSPEAFWNLLAEGQDAITEIPSDRWDIDAWYDSSLFCVDKMYTRHGAFLGNVDLFDAERFGINAREVVSMDPQQRILLTVCDEVLRGAGYQDNAAALLETGVFIGAIGNDFFQRFASAPETMDARTGTGNSNSVLAGRISFVFGMSGPSVVVDTSCSSSLVAVHQAVRSLRSGECGMAVAGGVNLMLHPLRTVALCRARMLSQDGRCKVFDETADGYGRGEGCGVVLLKRLSDARADGDRILGVIAGSAVNHNGQSSGLTVPCVDAQQMVIRGALNDAGVEAAAITYVEAHGTGTSLGDPLELEALEGVFGSVPNGLQVGSVKANIGHLEAAAGIASLIKVVKMLEHRRVPGNIHFNTPNPHVDWRKCTLQVSKKTGVWDAKDPLAGISSFGFSGTNAHVVIRADG